MTKIISAFAGAGKTTASQCGSFKVRDSDSYEFHWIDPFKRDQENPEWPHNYIEHAANEYVAQQFDAVLLAGLSGSITAHYAKSSSRVCLSSTGYEERV